jgi:hypothetical protein
MMFTEKSGSCVGYICTDITKYVWNKGLIEAELDELINVVHYRKCVVNNALVVTKAGGERGSYKDTIQHTRIQYNLQPQALRL